MKRTLSIILAGAAIAAAVPVIASAQPYGRGPGGYGPPGQYDNPGRGRGGYDPYPGPGGWAPGNINEREANIAQRIDEGERRGGLTRDESRRLRDTLRGIQRLEMDYRRNGFSTAEVRDLNRRLDALSAQVDRQRRDNDTRGNEITDRLLRIEQNINEGARNGGLTRSEAERLRYDLERLRRIVSDYRRSGDGFDARERADLNRRLDILANQVQAQRRDGQQRGGRY